MRMAACLLVLLLPVVAVAGVEEVLVVKVLTNDDFFIVERKNGERWLLEKGVGAISLWRYEGRRIVIDSPGAFGGIGSQVLLPADRQKARIWDAQLVN